MTTAATPHRRGPELILEHCALLDVEFSRLPATIRLEQAIGPSLARLLRDALSGHHRISRSLID